MNPVLAVPMIMTAGVVQSRSRLGLGAQNRKTARPGSSFPHRMTVIFLVHGINHDSIRTEPMVNS